MDEELYRMLLDMSEKQQLQMGMQMIDRNMSRMPMPSLWDFYMRPQQQTITPQQRQQMDDLSKLQMQIIQDFLNRRTYTSPMR